MFDFDYLITKDKPDPDDSLEDILNKSTETKTEALADCNVAALKEDAIVQFDRKGFFRIDKQFRHGDAAVAFQIPTGKKIVTASTLCQGLHVVRSYGALLETFDACADVSDYFNLHIEGQQDD
ncbi:hypothetical protein KC328_g9702 [Hortaea werneckii]|nr:hypothetical protein KC328_g9702 [Hortaea werneckii]